MWRNTERANLEKKPAKHPGIWLKLRISLVASAAQGDGRIGVQNPAPPCAIQDATQTPKACLIYDDLFGKSG
jgi:hypothetical protein